MSILIVTERTSQARDLRAALGDRFGQILPAEVTCCDWPSPMMRRHPRAAGRAK